MDLSIVVPVFNEADNIQLLSAEIHAHFAGQLEFELIFVDDGSSDASPSILSELSQQTPTVRVLRHASNAGQSAALLTGVRAAKADWIATLDGDGQNDPADLLRFWSLRSTAPAADLYIGHRVARQDSALRRFSSRVANGVRGRLLKDDAPDTGCGIKLFRRQLFLTLPYFDHMHRFLPALVRREGGQVTSVPVNHRPRLRGQSKYGVGNRLWVGLVDLLGVMWLLRRRRLPGQPVEEPAHEA